LPPVKPLLDCTEQIVWAATLLSDLVVFGRRAGQAAATHAGKTSQGALDNKPNR